MNSDRRDYIRKQAITVFELTKGFTPEQRQNFSNELNCLEEISGYVLELTDQLKQRDETIKLDEERMRNAFQEIQQLKQEIANHTAVNSLLIDSDSEADLANKLFKAQGEIQQLKEALREERNKAIDECMREIERLNDDGVLYESTARKVLEFLKSDSK